MHTFFLKSKPCSYPKQTVLLWILLTVILASCSLETNRGSATDFEQPPKIKVKLVIVTMFEIGDDTGDAPGEFQLWKERRELNERYEFKHSHHDLFYNSTSQILGMVTGIGTAKSATATMALGLDDRFDLTEAYWLVAGIAGIDPENASIGSVAWSSFLVDGDLGYEIDSREIPPNWDTGFFAFDTTFPYSDPRPEPSGEMFIANPHLRDWAFDLTKDLKLMDSDELATARAIYTDHPMARKPPFVLSGGHIAAMTFWHGKIKNDWANEWVRYWSDGATDFVTSAMEETGTYQALTYLDNINKVDKQRFMVLRGGSNYTMQPPTMTAAENLLRESDGYSGMELSLENIYLVGSVVIDELLKNWDSHGKQTPRILSQSESTDD